MSHTKKQDHARWVNLGAVPVRVDLASVAPMFYPVVERDRVASMAAAAASVGLPVAMLAQYETLARINQSGYVLVDCLRLGDPADSVCLALLPLNDGQTVAVCAAFVGELDSSADRASELAIGLADSLGPLGDGAPRMAFVGSFRPSQHGAKQ